MIARITILIFISLTCLSSAVAQNFPADTFQSPQNPWYWKNRNHPPDYWQQDVQYKIAASLNPQDQEIKGSLQLTYTNNSPDTLQDFYFHLYQNAFQPGSYYDQLKRIHQERPQYGPLEAQGKGTQVHSMTAKDRNITLKQDNTILHAHADRALMPGETIIFTVQFSSWFDTGSERRRMKVFPVDTEDGKSVLHFDAVHWYPRISVFDRRMTWDVQQHLSKEFYGDYGTYQVELTLPAEYILEATGELINEAEVLPDALKAKLNLKNFKDKPIGSPASIITPADGSTKTWKYHAVNVHDFAFTADPTYRIDEVRAVNVRCIAVAREENAAGWQDAAEINAKVIRLFSDYIGPYAYPKMVVADAQDGMEYPMLTLDGGHSPGYTALLAHEIGHNWFFGMIGSNETYRAFMDEGFTQFLTMWAMDSLKGHKKEGISSDRLRQGYLKFMLEAGKQADGYLNTHSDAFYAETGHGGQYSMQYHKTAVMLYNLQYMLGDKEFQNAMQFYFRRWAMAHPYPEDFRQAITDYTRRDLTRFFDDWMETDRRVEYGIRSKKQAGDSLRITFSRSGDLIMPLDFTVYNRQGKASKFLLPADRFAKTDSGRTVLPYWYQFGELGRKHAVSVYAPDAKKVVIDPTQRLGDYYLLNNQSGIPPHQLQLRWHDHNAYRADGLRYVMTVRPNLWWNNHSGIQTGAMLHGQYMNHFHRLKAGIWYHTGIMTSAHRVPAMAVHEGMFPDFSWIADYQTPFAPLGRDGEMQLFKAFRDGAWRNQAGLSKWYTKGASTQTSRYGWYASWVWLYRPEASSAAFLYYPDTWNTGSTNAYLKAGWRKEYRIPHGQGDWSLEFRNAAPGSDADYRNVRFESRYDVDFMRKAFTLRYRLYMQVGEGNTPLESQTYLAGGNPEDMWGDDFYRSTGFFPNAWAENDMGRTTANLHFGGGYNLRGYAGYRAEFEDGAPAWYGNNGAALNIEIEFDNKIPFRPRLLKNHAKLDAYLFADAGIIGRNLPRVGFDKVEFDKLRANFGPGAALSLYRNRARNTKPLIIRADFPLLLTATPFTQDNFQFRWLIGIGRSF